MTDPVKEKLREMEGFVEVRCLGFEGESSEQQLVIYNASVNPNPRKDFENNVNIYFLSKQDIDRLGVHRRLSKLPKLDVNKVVREVNGTTVEDSNRTQSQRKSLGKPVIGTDRFGNEWYYESLSDVAMAGFTRQLVSACCYGKRTSHKGYTWRFADGRFA